MQLAFDTERNGGLGYDQTDDHEINFALAEAKLVLSAIMVRLAPATIFVWRWCA